MAPPSLGSSMRHHNMPPLACVINKLSPHQLTASQTAHLQSHQPSSLKWPPGWLQPQLRQKRPNTKSAFGRSADHPVPTLTPGAMAWPKWHSAELSHRVRIAHHRARHERAHLPSPLQSHGSSPTALRSHVDCLAHRPLHWKARPILTLCPCVCVSR